MLWINTNKFRRSNIPRLSLYKPERGNDYYFIDRQVQEAFTIGGTDVNVHKYIGPLTPTEDGSSPTQPIHDIVSETSIQDMLFLENRDRKYDPNVYTSRGIYNLQDLDFDLSQFGLFLANDTIFLTVHINSIVKTLGRKPISGDVIELPHLKDEYALNNEEFALKRFYVIEDVNRAAEGYSVTWYPHLYRLKLKQIYDGQEYSEILDLPAGDDTDTTLRDMLSTYEKEMQISSAVVAQAEQDSPLSGFDISHFYTISLDDDGLLNLTTADSTDLDASGISITTDEIIRPPEREGYSGYLVNYGDSSTPNGSPFGIGTTFPRENYEGDYFLRTDFMPNRLFRYDGVKWAKVNDNLRMTLTNTNDRQTLKTGFINNTNVNTINGEEVQERQSVSSALRPKADN